MVLWIARSFFFLACAEAAMPPGSETSPVRRARDQRAAENDATAPKAGAWQSLTETSINQAQCQFQYKYTYNGLSYVSPVTNLKWSFNSFQELPGTYTYDGGGSMDCAGGSGINNAKAYGIGCSNAPGDFEKVLPWSSNPTSGKDNGTGWVCQNKPNIWGGPHLAKCMKADLYFRCVSSFQPLTECAITASTCSQYQYQYTAAGMSYTSPVTSLKWSYSSFQEVGGTYTYYDSNGAPGSFDCPAGSATNGQNMSKAYGIGCSVAGGGGPTAFKVLPWSQNPSAGACCGFAWVCQNQPNIWGGVTGNKCPNASVAFRCV